ncbi:Two pore calcium channel protein 1 [Tyrophagus putrescentiae]|nr:Two pore calcium channel protein 1 [Tyrophagus putrescentiae]
MILRGNLIILFRPHSSTAFNSHSTAAAAATAATQTKTMPTLRTRRICPICQSYSDLEESIRLESPTRSRFLAWFSRHFILPSVPAQRVCQQPSTRWSLNYREAAIYLEEGYNNDKFDYHPAAYRALPAYLAVHNHAYYLVDLLACLLLLSLAIFERPAVDGLDLDETVHASVELLGLATVAAVTWIKFQWMGWRYFARHRRTMIKAAVLGLMVAEAVVVLLRQDSHFRVTRSLRPVFLIDNYYFGGVRRVIRQTIQSLRSFLEMLLLQMFFLLFFAISAFYLFSSVPHYEAFSSMWNSFLSLFVLLTTSNYPDVMMPAYKQGQLYVLFFVFFLVVNLYFLLNIMLAVVYTAFSQIEKDKFRKLLLHRRRACEHAFRLLVSSRGAAHHVSFAHFCGLLEQLRPASSLLERYLMYRALLSEDHDDLEVARSCDGSGGSSGVPTPVKTLPKPPVNENRLTLDRFYNIYEVLYLKWRDDTEASLPWFERTLAGPSCWPLRALLRWLYLLVTHRLFTTASYLVIVLATAYQLLDAVFGQERWEADLGLPVSTALICALFIGVYSAEVALKLLALGPAEYFRHRWNVFDLAVTAVSLVTFMLARLQVTTSNVPRYRDILGPFAFIIFKRFTSVMLVVLIVYYFFAIIAMELFGGYELRDCCRNSTIEAYYQEGSGLFYYLNNFNDLASSYVTLFELMVVNNWPITMKAYVLVSGRQLASLFFMVFFMISLLVITIVIAFVIDTIQFQIKYKARFGAETLKAKIEVVVRVTGGQAEALRRIQGSRSGDGKWKGVWGLGCLEDGNGSALSRRLQSFLRMLLGASSPSFERMTSPYKGTAPGSHAINMNSTEEIPVPTSRGADHQQMLTFTGTRFRDKFSYNLRMYSDEIQKWIM